MTDRTTDEQIAEWTTEDYDKVNYISAFDILAALKAERARGDRLLERLAALRIRWRADRFHRSEYKAMVDEARRERDRWKKLAEMAATAGESETRQRIEAEARVTEMEADVQAAQARLTEIRAIVDEQYDFRDDHKPTAATILSDRLLELLDQDPG